MSLGNTLSAAAARHKRIALDLIRSSDVSLKVRVRAARSPASGASYFADLDSAQPELADSVAIPCLWHDSTTSVTSSSRERSMQLMGKYPAAVAFAEVVLEDVLEDPDDVRGETLFDTGKDVVFQGQKFKVLAVERYGMANTAPYLAAVVLAGEVRNRA